MRSITFMIQAKPIARQYQIFNTPVKEPSRGPGAAECDCGQHFAAFMRDPKAEYHAFVDSVARGAKIAMDNIGEPAPFAGGLRLSVVVTVKRPLRHYIGNDASGPLKAASFYEEPTGSPNMVKVLDSIEAGLSGVAIDSANQITDYTGTKKVYGRSDRVEITISQTRTDEATQPTLF